MPPPGISKTPVLIATLFLVACVAAANLEKSRGETLKQYQSLVRWSEWDGAVGYLAPEFLEEHPVSRLDLERLRLFRVTQYIVRATQNYDEGKTTVQMVEIHLFNKAQAVERSIIDEQLWRYDETAERWFLHSGLPDPTKRY